MNALDANHTAHKLLLVAERLLAEEGVDAVSTRRISVEAGQRNNSALQYHFGSMDGLLEALLEYRQGVINRRRLALLNALEDQSRLDDLAALLDAMVRPFLELLGDEPQASYYLNLVSQLHSQERHGLLYKHDLERGRSLRLLGEHLSRALASLPDAVSFLRQELAGVTLTHIAARWAHARRQRGAAWTEDEVNAHTAQLVEFLLGGLCAATNPDDLGPGGLSE